MKLELESKSIVSISHEFKGYVVKIIRSNFSRFRSLVESYSGCSIDIPDKWPSEPKVTGPPPKSIEDAPKPPTLSLTFRGNVGKCEEAKNAFIDLLNKTETGLIQHDIKSLGICRVVEFRRDALMKDYNSNGGADESSADDDSCNQSCPCSISLYRTYVQKKGEEKLKGRLNIKLCYLPPESEEDQVFERAQFDEMRATLEAEIAAYKEISVDFKNIRATFDQSALSNEGQLKHLLYPIDGVYFVKLQLRRDVIVGGTDNGVEEARNFLQTGPKDEQIVVEAIKLDNPNYEMKAAHYASLLVSAPYDAELKSLMDLVKLPSRSIPLSKTKGKSTTVIFNVEGKRSDIQTIKNVVRTQANTWIGSLENEPVSDVLSPLQLNYLKDEGSTQLKQTAKKCGVVITSSTSHSTMLPSIPLSYADHSLNRKVLRGEIAGANPVYISVETGNLLNAICGAIANPANGSLNNFGGVAKAISDAGGSKFDDDCKSYIKQNGDICVGTAVVVGFVNNSAVVHAVGPKFNRTALDFNCRLYEKTIRSALSAACKAGHESIALPLFGSGVYGWSPELAAQLTVRAISSWASEAPKSFQIVLVMTDATEDIMVKALKDFSSSPLPTDEPESEVISGPPIPKYSYFWQKYPWEDHLDEWTPYDYDQSMQIEHAIEENELPVRLIGDKGGRHSDSKHIPDGKQSAEYLVERREIVSKFDKTKYDYLQKNVVSKAERPVKLCPFDPSNPMPLFPTPQIPAASSDNIRYSTISLHSSDPAVVMGGGGSASHSPPTSPLKMEHSASSVGGSLNDKFIEGKRVCIESFKVEIRALVEKKKRAEDFDLSNLYEYGDISGDLMKMFEDEIATVEMVSSFRFKLTAYGRTFDDAARRVYKFQMKMLEDLNKVVWPEEWPKDVDYDLSQSQCEFIPVPVGSQEYQRVEDEFRGRTNGPRNMFHNGIVKVERVQNPEVWNAYYNHCKHLVSTLPVDNSKSLFENVNEHWMKHGTSRTDPKEVAGSESGVDHRYSEQGFFGRGAYTAEDAEYTDSGYSYKCGDGNKQMLLVRVAAGNISEQGNTTPDTRAFIKPPRGYHSVRGVVKDIPQMKALVVYDWMKIYPAYLITYKSKP